MKVAYDRKFGTDIPSEKQQLKEWSAHKIKLGLQEKIKQLYEQGTLPAINLAHKHLETLIKMQKFFDQAPQLTTNNVMFVTKFENEEEWNRHAKQHAKRITALDANADLATDPEQQSGTSDSESS